MKVLGQFFDAEDALSKDNFHISMDLYNSETRWDLAFHDSEHASRRLEYPWVVQNVRNITGPILDAGCGETAIGLYLAANGHKVTAVDYYFPTVNKLEKIIDEYGIKRYRAVYGDITNLTYEDNTFEVSYCVSVIEHLPVSSIPVAINGLLRVTRKKLLITLDVMLESSDGFNITALAVFMEQFGIAITPPTTIFRIDNKPMGVYGIIFEKD